MARRALTWAERARQHIGDVLERLGPGADYEQKRLALREAYPWGIRKHLPYKVWCREVSAALIGAKAQHQMHKPIGGLKVPRRAPADVKLFLQTMADNPTTPGPRLVLADYLEERGDSRAQLLRESPGVTVQRAGRMYMRLSGSAAVKTIQGMLKDILEGRRRLIIDKHAVDAVELCKTVDALKLFRGENA